MSLTAAQRANLAWANRPPGPQAMWSALGSATRALGQAMDKLGIALEGDAAYIEKLPIPTTVVKIDGKAPSIGEASFVAPSANLIGAVQLGPGASAWYGALLKGDTKPVSVGKLSSVGEHASVGLRANPNPDRTRARARTRARTRTRTRALARTRSLTGTRSR